MGRSKTIPTKLTDSAATEVILKSEEPMPDDDVDTPPQRPRERGTLKDTLPRKPIFVILLVCLISALLATMLAEYSLEDLNEGVASERRWTFWGVACLGSGSTLVGILYGDSLSHAFAFGVAVS